MDEGDGVTNRGRGAAKKTNLSRRTWSKNEEKVLMAALKDLVANGWKSDNGFRTGYLFKLEDAVRKVYPNTDLKAEPQIMSKLTTWKKTYGAIISMQRDTTGVGFNTTTNTLEVTDEQWESVLKKDPKMKGMRYKEWPMFPEWVEVFGKDRATGDVAEDITDGASTMKRQREEQDTNPESKKNAADYGDDNYVNLDDPGSDFPMFNGLNEEYTEDSTAFYPKFNPESSTKSGRKKKQKVDVVDGTMVNLLQDLCRSTGDRLQTIAKRIGYDHDLCHKREKVFGLLGHVPNLTTLQKIEVSEIIGAKVEKLDIFMGLNEDARAVYALHLLTHTSR